MKSLYDDGRRYDSLFGGPNDLPFYRKQIERYGGPVLELACGTGRLTIPLSVTGVDITGIDSSASMLEVARAKAAQSQALQSQTPASFLPGDMRDYNLGKQFQLIFVACNSLSHLLEPQEIESCLRCTRNHLAPGGRFVVDVFTPSLQLLTRDPSQPSPIGQYNDPDGQGRIVVTATDHYDTATQVNHSTWHYANTDTQERWDIPFSLRMFYPQEIDALLRCSGFTIEHKFGGFDESPYGHASSKQLIVCR